VFVFRQYISFMAKKAGRPQKRVTDAKGNRLQVRVEDAEKEAFTAAARLAGQDVSVWVRATLRRVAREELERAGEPVAFAGR